MQSGCPQRLVMDNIVYSLQRAGGGSVYWSNLQSRLIEDPTLDVEIIERTDAVNNIIRAKQGHACSTNGVNHDLPLRIDEIRKVPVSGKCLFHSSDYRLGVGRGCINITTVYDFICKKYYSGITQHFSIWQISRAVRHSQGLICISESTKRDLLEYIPSAASIPTTVICLGFDSTYTYRSVARLKQVAFIGSRGSSYKNFQIAVDSVALVPDLELVIIGSPLTHEEEMMLQARIPGRYKSVVFPSSNEICGLFNESVALLYLSEYEGFGLPVLEAMASGLPVIALNTSSIPEVGGNAAKLLDEPAPEEIACIIKDLMDNDAGFELTVKEGLAQAALFSWDRTARETRMFYDEMWKTHE